MSTCDGNHENHVNTIWEKNYGCCISVRMYILNVVREWKLNEKIKAREREGKRRGYVN